MSDIASVADEPLTRAQIHMGEPEGEPLLDAVDLVAGYIPGVNILNGASLTLHEGEIVGIIGPNGAGKSTLLKSLFGLVHIHSGKLLLKGEDITNLRADKLVSRGVGFVPQTENVFPQPDHRGKPAHGRVPSTETVQRTLRLRVLHLPQTRPAQKPARRPTLRR